MPLARSATAATIPASILDAVLHALHEHGDTTPIQRVQRVKGGYESTSVRLTTRRRHYFLKWASAGAQGGFQAEAAHLSLLAVTGAVTVPAVLRAVDPPERAAGAGMQTPAGDALGFLLMEWLTPPSREVFQHRVGRELGTAVARMHAAQAIGEVPIGGYGPAAAIHDATAWRVDWVAHYRDELLRPQIDLAAREDRLSAASCTRLERLLDRLDAWLGGVARQPALMHGDLHRANVLCNAAGALVLIDPHPFFADRELELAYMDWVGGFPPAFYLTYEATYPCAPERQERRDLYLLYWRLQRLNWADSLWSQQAAPIEAVVRLYVGTAP
jgi:protein-ribulosamine 3-kinase